jgi:hypothetical protein
MSISWIFLPLMFIFAMKPLLIPLNNYVCIKLFMLAYIFLFLDGTLRGKNKQKAQNNCECGKIINILHKASRTEL